MVTLAEENLTSKALELRKKDVSYDDISKDFEKQGYNPTQREEAINQSKLATVSYPHDDTKVSEEEIPIPSQKSDIPSSEDISSLPANNAPPQEQRQRQNRQSQPQFNSMPQFTSNIDPTQTQAVIESIIEEKWHTLVQDIGDYKNWKDKTELQVKAIKQEIIRTQTRFEILEKSILGKIKDYDQNVTEFSTDIKALSKVFQKILEPLKENIQELSRITQELKK